MPEGDALATTSSTNRTGAIKNGVSPRKRTQPNPTFSPQTHRGTATFAAWPRSSNSPPRLRDERTEGPREERSAFRISCSLFILRPSTPPSLFHILFPHSAFSGCSSSFILPPSSFSSSYQSSVVAFHPSSFILPLPSSNLSGPASCIASLHFFFHVFALDRGPSTSPTIGIRQRYLVVWAHALYPPRGSAT